ncbi:uncharacterized protein PAC_17455 [Phialocephala subalpina]|uniref:C2H2-type domain-containing protein n=1 Tax=Phialocephala subalpina TaxID=576137 RepID=A0A1L7XR83_9HELO|nr:uncharacterized protein PAC_17455 [Phialocephala subalpina]
MQIWGATQYMQSTAAADSWLQLRATKNQELQGLNQYLHDLDQGACSISPEAWAHIRRCWASYWIMEPANPLMSSLSKPSPLPVALTQQAETSGRSDDASDEVNDIYNQSIERQVSISTLYSECVSKLNALIASIQQTAAATEVQELGSRLQIWAGNHGAHRNQSDRLSLDYRLRESLELHQEVRDHFRDLIQAIDDGDSLFPQSHLHQTNTIPAITTSSGGDTVDLPDLSYDSSSGSESSLTSSQKALIGVTISRKERSPAVKLDTLLQTIKEIITSLYKFSITIQNPAHRDRTARASKIDVSFWSQFDLTHVRDKFPKCSNEQLLRDLAQANTKRRQIFSYHKRHRDKVQHFRESLLQEGSHVNTGQLENALDEKPSLPANLGAPTIHTGNTKLTQTTVSTIRPPLAPIAVSVSGRSQRTTITNDPVSTSKDLLTVPPPPNDASDFDKPFVCPYCYLVIDPRDQKQWEIHVLDDLRPYVCTFGDCVSAAVLYDRYSEWRTHELEVHRREWFCNFCNTTYDTRKGFVEHLDLRHKTLITGEYQLESLISLCERTSTRDEDCPLCANFTGNVNSVQHHLAQHLRQLALYTLPKLVTNDTEENQAESDVANVRHKSRKSDASSDDTKRELLQIPEAIFEGYLETVWSSPPNSPSQGPPLNRDYHKLLKSFGQEKNRHLEEDARLHTDVIDFLLSSFPLLISAAEHLRERFEPLKDWAEFRPEFISFIDSLDFENRLIHAMVERALAGPFNSLRQRLGPSYVEYMSTISTIRALVEELQGVLFIDPDGTFNWADEGASKWDYQLKRIRLSFSKRGPKTLAALEKHNRKLRELLDSNEKFEPLKTTRNLTVANNFMSTRLHGRNVYDVLTRGWRCACLHGHAVTIELDPIPSPDSTWTYQLLISTSKPRLMLKVDINHAADTTKSNQVQEIVDLCLALTSLEGPAPYTLGCMSGPAESRYILRVYEGNTMIGVCSLAELLGSGWLYDRRLIGKLASVLASAFLHLVSTPWLPEHGIRKEDILFCRTPFALDIEKPYLLHNFGYLDRTMPMIPTVPNSSRFIARNNITSLGILLLELRFDTAIEDCSFRKPYLRPDGNPHEHTNLLAARDWSESVREEDPEWQGIVRCCLSCTFEETPDWESKKFVQEVYEKVVEPLEKIRDKLTKLEGYRSEF